MCGFVVPLLVGFGFNLASAFTSYYSRRWGERGGSRVTFALRVVLGMPLWILGLALAMRAQSNLLFGPSSSLEGLAWAGIVAGTLPMLLGLRELGGTAALPSVGDTLMERGIYGLVRHPIYAGMLLEFLGMALLRPTLAVLLACGLGLAWVVVQARLEEEDLLDRLPQYAAYRRRVPPFFPRIGSGR
jgi:protein-S-isoprenylcysteine O-methyltransferase Ste14